MKINNKSGRIRRFLFWGLITAIVLPSATFLFKNVLNSVEDKSAPTLKVEKIEFYFDKIYSAEIKLELQNYISRYVADCDKFWNFNQHKLYQELKSKFKIIKSFDCRIDDKSTLKFEIEGQNPFCFVNKNEILTESDLLLSAQLFEDFDCSKLPNINVKNNEQNLESYCIDVGLHEFVHKITALQWENFEINYVKPSEIRLCPKNTNFRCILLSSSKTFFDNEKIDKALQLLQKIAIDNVIQKKLKYTNKKTLVLDLRFKNSIVAKAESEVKEGGDEEVV